jgi:agmatine/peptidylarginine deiminase
MKQIYILLVIIALAGATLAAETVRLGSEQNSVSVISSNAGETVIHYRVSEFEQIPVQIDGRTYHQIRLPKEGFTQDKGFPELPVLNRSILIPAATLMKIDVTEVEYQDVQLQVAPSRGIITRDQDPGRIPYVFDGVYQTDAFYPGTLAGLSESYILRDFRGITVKTVPFAYNPRTGVLRVFTSYRIRVYADGVDGRNVISADPETISRAFQPIYENHFLNWNAYRYIPVDDSYGKLLVISHSNYMSAILPYVNWKKQKGIDTELIEWSTIGTTATQLQTYIQNRYNADASITFVQLVGDAPQIPSLTSGGGGSDPSFSLVAGSDNYPDIFIGRFSAESVVDVTAQINKAIVYERDLSTSATWLNRGMGIASAEGGGSLGDNGESDIAHMNLIRTDLLGYGYTSVDQIYDPGASASTVATNINAGRGFVNYVGHGSNTSWSTTGFSNTNASALTNGSMTPFIMDVACVNGNFVSITCFAEAWLRNPNGGAVAMYASSINQSWNSPMRAQDEVTDLLISEAKNTAGGLYYNGSCKMMDIYGSTTGSDGVNMFKTWHIFGDASLTVRTKTPLAMNVTHPAQIVMGSYTVNVSTGVANSLVALTHTNTLYASGYTDAGGNASLTLIHAPQTALDYTITATAFNRVTYVGTIQQVPGSGPYLAVDGVTYSDANNNAPDYNESGYLSVVFHNIGAAAAENVTTLLSCSTPGISILDSGEGIASLAADAVLDISNAYSISIGDGVADGTAAQFNISMTDGDDVWSHDFSLVVNAPQLAFGDVAVLDPAPGNGNGLLDPGETASITILLHNTGASASPSGSAGLSSPTAGITVLSAAQGVAPISAGGSAVLTFSVSASSSLAQGSPAILNFSASAGAYSAATTETLSVGLIPQAVLGSGTSNTGTSTASPINIYYKSSHGQSVYTASELNAAGIYGPIYITQLGFYIASLPNLALPNFIIRMKHTADSNVASWQTATGMTTVYANSSYMPVAGGYQLLNLSTPFEWNGTSNIVVDTAFGLVSSWSSSGSVQYTSQTSGYRYTWNDYSDQTNVFSGGYTSTYRPNVMITLQPIQVNAPLISVNPSSLSQILYTGESASADLTITNGGTAQLSWSLQGGGASWHGENPSSGTIEAGNSAALTVSFDSQGLAAGTYNDALVILSNASNNPSLSVPLTLTVQEPPFPANPRYVAEWEPAVGAVIRYPLGLPYALIGELASDDLLYVVVSSANQSSCASALSSNGVNMANVRYVNAATDTYWIRDYGPWYVFGGENGTQMQIADFTYNRPRPNDDAIPSAIASYLGIPVYDIPVTHTGGNIMTDGQGKAMSTELVLDENSSLTQTQINTMFADYLGVTDYQLYEDPNNTYIDHIDCWGKLLDVDKVLIRSVPASHAQYAAIEAVVADWQGMTSSYGTPYQIYRVYTPNDEPYTNSYFLNGKIFVPLMNTANDAAALQVYQNAMPGYEVHGYTYSTFESTDAIHCRVNTVFDAQMVHLEHVPPVAVASNQMLPIQVEITHSNPLDLAESFVAYRYSPSAGWQYASLASSRDPFYAAQIPTPAVGEAIQYWIRATDTTGRTSTLPLCAANDPFDLIVTQQGPNFVPTIDLPESFSFDQNASLNLDFSPWVHDGDHDPLVLSCSGNSSVQVEIAGMSVTLSAAGDWAGTEEVTFTVSDGEDSASSTVDVIVNLLHLASPAVQVSCSGGNVVLAWASVPNAVSYNVYACGSYDGVYELIATTTGLDWSEPVGPGRRFYKVIASSETTRSKP